MTGRVESAGRSFGLGAVPSDTMLEKMCRCPFPQVPVIEYVTWTIPLPLTDTAIGQTFGDEIDVLSNSKQVAGVAAVDSSFVMNGILQTTMFVVGLGVHAFAEPFTFSQIGNSIASGGCCAPGSMTPPVSPDVFSANDAINGALTGVTGITAPINPADLEWGFADWNAAWHMANAYQLQWTFQQRHLLINELMADVAWFGSYADGEGMGTSDASVTQYAAQVNNQYASLGATQRFLPVSHRRVGSFNGAPTGPTGPNVGLFHPTNDYKLAPVTWGGLQSQGTNHGGTPFRKFAKPIVIDQGIPIGLSLNLQDSYHYKQMVRYMSISEGAGTNAVANVMVDPNINGYTVATGNAGLELTMNPGGASFANQSVDTDRQLFKGGVMKLAFLIRGFEVYGQWKKYFCDNGKMLAPYVDVPNVTGTIGGLAGIPTNA
jgi:hypothetical protein